MSAGKKWMVVLSVLATGIGAALFFRKDASQIGKRQEVADEFPFPPGVERRVVDGLPAVGAHSSPQAARTQAFRVPTAAPAAFTQGAPAPGEGQPQFQKSFNPVGALLAPVAGPVEAAAESGAPLDAEEPADRSRLHKIVDGDTLSQLAARYLGSSGRYLDIFDYNRDVLTTPDLLPIGVVIKIPPVAATSAQRPSESPADPGPESPPDLVPVEPRPASPASPDPDPG